MRRWFIVASAALTIGLADRPAYTAAPAAQAAPAADLVVIMGRAEQEAFLLRAKIDRVRDASKGITGTRRVTLVDGAVKHDASVQVIDEFKNRFEGRSGVEFDFKDSWKFNVAAYLLDQLLDLNMIPVSVERAFQSKDASFTWWVDNVLMDEETRLKSKQPPPNPQVWNNQMHVVRVFDELIQNVDRNMGNLLIDTSWRVWMIDHSRAFRLHKKLKNPAVLQKIERQLLAKLRALDAAVAKKTLQKYLTGPEIDALLERRSVIVAHFDQLGEKSLYTAGTPGAAPPGAPPPDAPPQPGAGAANQLTAQEQRDGWRLLFDGKSLDGWRGYKRPDAAATRWRVEDGWLTLPANDGKDTRGARDLISTDTFDRFELAFEWKVAQAGNSGVKYFILEDMDSAIGHEYQVIDDERHPDAKIGIERQTGSFYDVLTPSNRRLKPAGELNQGRIVVRGPAVEHWLNGDRVLTYELDSPALRTAIVDSKFKDVTRFGKLTKGHILVQDHGDQVWYRNIKVRPLPAGK